jgi:hypothetical protein
MQEFHPMSNQPFDKGWQAALLRLGSSWRERHAKSVPRGREKMII